MQKTKQFTQFSDNSFSISVKIGIKGNVTIRSILNFYGKYYKQKNKEWRKNNKTHINKKRKEWENNNKEQLKKYRTNYYTNNSKHNKYMKDYYIKNKEHILELNKKYLKTNDGKKTRIKHHATRRDLGFNSLNNPFKNCEGHHIDKTNVIFIPKEIHRSVSHNIWTGKNMHEINNLAIDYYWGKKFKKYGVIK